MGIQDKFIKSREEQFLPYEEIQITEKDLSEIKRVSWDVFSKLHDITEYRLAMELSKDKITKAEFDWAMRYWRFLKEYFKNSSSWQK